VWQVSWAHPKFGTILASASYDSRVIIWRDSSTSPQQSTWIKLFEHTLHTSSVNSISWAPHSLGAILACASSDGKVSVLEFKDDGSWDTKVFNAHGMGCNAASWAPAITPGSLISTQPQASGNIKKIATGGCDNLVKIWAFEYNLFQLFLICLARREIIGSRRRYYKAIPIGFEMLPMRHQLGCPRHILHLLLKYHYCQFR
jgi:protein transport protein SEC13